MLNFSHNSTQALMYASELATKTGGLVCTEHLLYGLLRVDNSTAKHLLNMCGLRAESFIKLFEMVDLVPNVEMSRNAHRVMDDARDVASTLGCRVVGTEHILYAMLDEPASVATMVLSNAGIDTETLQRMTYDAIVKNSGNKPSMCGASGADKVSDILDGYKQKPLGKQSYKEQNDNIDGDDAVFEQSAD